MKEDCQYVSICFLIERDRLRDWVSSVGLDRYTDEASVSASIKSTRLPLLAILTEIRSAITKFLILNGKYSELKPPDQHKTIHIAGEELVGILGSLDIPPESSAEGHGGFLEKVKNFGGDIKNVATHPRRIKWVVFDKKRAEVLLKKLRELNDCLRELLDAHQTRILLQTTQNTYIELIQMHDTVEGLRYLLEAANLAQSSTGFADLADLARFKSLNISEQRLSPLLHFNEFVQNPSENRKGRNIAHYKDHGTTSGGPLWIEWKEFKVDLGAEVPQQQYPEIMPRIEELARLLTAPKPTSMCVPPCLGYFMEREPETNEGYFGFVYTAPNAQSTMSTSLLDAMSKEKEPSLTDRYALAGKLTTCMLYLHSVDWLHKSFRSENVLFFFRESLTAYSQPYLMGFEYSRPSRMGEKTDPVPWSPETELYCHPDILLTGKHPQYRKTFDIYSLGVVMLEIALWQPVRQIFPNDDEDEEEEDEENEDQNEDETTDKVKLGRIQKVILERDSDLSSRIRAKVGNKYYDALRTCIGGRESFGIRKESLEADSQAALHLQQAFKDLVVDRLKDAAL